MLSLDSRLEGTVAPSDGIAVQTPLARKLRVAGLAILGVVLGVPLLIGGAGFLFWEDIDKELRRVTSQPGTVEPAELDGKSLSLFNRKMAAVRATLEAEPFVTFSLTELNSQVNFLLNTGGLSQALANFRIEAEGDSLVLRSCWTGPEMSRILIASGWSPANPIVDRLLQYARQLAFFQLDAIVQPRAQGGKFTWDITRARLHGYPIPAEIARSIQASLLSGATAFEPGPTGRPLKEAKMTAQGLLLKWSRPS